MLRWESALSVANSCFFGDFGQFVFRVVRLVAELATINGKTSLLHANASFCSCEVRSATAIEKGPSIQYLVLDDLLKVAKVLFGQHLHIFQALRLEGDLLVILVALYRLRFETIVVSAAILAFILFFLLNLIFHVGKNNQVVDVFSIITVVKIVLICFMISVFGILQCPLPM